MKRLLIIICALTGMSLGCGELEDGPGDDIAWMQEHTEDYLGDHHWRRAELEASMWRPDLPYARKQLVAYGLGDSGWDLLPELDAASGALVVGEDSGGLRELSTEVPVSREEWLELGEEVFWRMPMRRDAYVDWLVERPELLDEVGIDTNEDGTVQGLVRYEDVRGDERVGITCGLCHGEDGVAGQARSDLDLGWGRAVFNEAHQRPVQEFLEWGAGRVDVTDDGVSDPLQIPDLWGVKYQTHINSSGVVKLDSPAALALRFETQYILGHNLEARPNRVHIWALAIYVLSLEYDAHEPEMESAGAAVFEANCASCHSPDTGFSGGLVEASLMVDSGQAATSPFRGTGMLKVPSLIGVSDGAPYLHGGQYDSLRGILDGGHPYGDKMEDVEIDELLNFLETL